MAISSYGASTQSSGIVRILKDLEDSVEGQHILVVEDIVDSGLTLDYLLRSLAARGPASIKVCGLLVKERPRELTIADRLRRLHDSRRFVVGYGLDFAETVSEPAVHRRAASRSCTRRGDDRARPTEPSDRYQE